MCGVFGYLTSERRLNHKARRQRWQMLRLLMIRNASRGTDGTGVGYITAKGEIHILKAVIHPREFAQHERFGDVKKQNPVCVIGHTRRATSGCINAKNAHPFHCGQIVGAHNGIIENAEELYPDIEVDSQAVFRILDEEGIEGLRQLRGFAALTWISTSDRRVGFYKHDAPLTLVYVPKLATLFWSSEEHDLVCALKAVGVTYCYEVPLESNRVYFFQEGRDFPIGKHVPMMSTSIVVSPINWVKLRRKYRGFGGQMAASA